MKIGIVSVGNDSLELFRFLRHHHHDYHVYYDANSWPLGDKSFGAAQAIVQAGYDFLLQQGMDCVIVPPLRELLWVGSDIPVYSNVLPLFSHYVLGYCFPSSLVGKIGVLCDPLELRPSQSGQQFGIGQRLLHDLEHKFSLRPNQRATKSFHSPFAYRCKDVRMWKYFLRSLQPREYLVNKVVKFDLKYFGDAMVDTIIPLNYAFFAFEKTIQRFFNAKKQKFHPLSCVEKAFVDLSGSVANDSSLYHIHVYCRGDDAMLLSRKRYVWMLQQGLTHAFDWSFL